MSTNFIYIVLEMTRFEQMVYPTTYASYQEAVNAIKRNWMAFLEEDVRVNGGDANELWNETEKNACLEKENPNCTKLYIEKENFFEIHKLPLPSQETH